jgi:hypothetical protein
MIIYLPVGRKKASYLLNKFPELVKQEAEPDGRGFTSIYIPDGQLEKAWQSKTVNQSLPWRYRKSPVKIRLFPTPKGCSTDSLATTLSVMSFRKIRDRVTAQFGGRCQICGHARFNKKERRIAPHVYTTWLHTPHPNQKKRMGIREILGLASVCDDCLGPLSLADPTPCEHAPASDRRQEVQKSIHRLALHNQLSRDETLRAIRRSIAERTKGLDRIFWVLNLRWIAENKLLKPEEVVLSRQYIKHGYSLTRDYVVVPPAKKPGNQKGQAA